MHLVRHIFRMANDYDARVYNVSHAIFYTKPNCIVSVNSQQYADAAEYRE